jgi:hypothetical protein
VHAAVLVDPIRDLVISIFYPGWIARKNHSELFNVLPVSTSEGVITNGTPLCAKAYSAVRGGHNEKSRNCRGFKNPQLRRRQPNQRARTQCGPIFKFDGLSRAIVNINCGFSSID